MVQDIEAAQKDLCRKYGVPYTPSPPDLIVGIALNVREGIVPVNGHRHPPEGVTTGWYIWSGDEFSTDPEFFEPLHAKHLAEWCPAVLKYLGLPPGWRFLLAEGYEDVWFDQALLET